MSKEIGDKFVYTWSIIELFMNGIFVMLFSYIANLFLIIYIELRFKINLYNLMGLYSEYVIPTIFVIIIYYRKKIIVYIMDFSYKKRRLDRFYNIERVLLWLEIFFPLYTVLTLYLNKFWPEYITDNVLLLSTTITFIYFPLYFIFTTILTDEGSIFIEFNEFSKNIYDVFKRQRWLKKICNRISRVFKKNKVIIDEDELISSFTLQLKNIEDIEIKINNMKNWFLSEEKKEDILIIIDDIWPKLKKEPHIRLKWNEYVQLLPYPYLKLLLGFFMALVLSIIVLIIKPSSILEIFDIFMKNI